MTKTKTKNTHGGAGRGQGRKPGDPALRRVRAIAVKCTEAEYAQLVALAERAGHEELATWVRETALSAVVT